MYLSMHLEIKIKNVGIMDLEKQVNRKNNWFSN